MLLRLYEEQLSRLTPILGLPTKQTAATERCRELVMQCVFRNPNLPDKYLQPLLRMFSVTIIKVIMLAVHVMFEGVSELLLWT